MICLLSLIVIHGDCFSQGDNRILFRFDTTSFNLSTASVIQCNTADGNDVGIFFGGDCDIYNDLTGNTMNNCTTGLLLNNVARIGKQVHRGNRWLPTTGSTTVAINQNTQNFNYLLSEMKFNPNDGTFLAPAFISPPAWFYQDPQPVGTTFNSCGIQVCNAALAGGGSDMEEHLKNVARDSAISYDYREENLNLAQQNLYKQLYEDSLLRVSDSVFTNFFSNKQSAAIGKLYEVNSLYSLSTVYDSVYKAQYAILDSLISLKTDSIRILDSLMFADSTLNYFSMREVLINNINAWQDSLKNLIHQKQTEAEPLMDSARNVNATITSGELPETNSKAMNEFHYLFYAFGKDTLLHYYHDMLSIAHQCPYAGGSSVYRARNFAAMFYDTLEYNDQDVCLQSGIYRKQSVNTATASVVEEYTVRIIPNPADDVVEIIINSSKGICRIEIMNVTGEVVKQGEYNCIEPKHLLSTKDFSSGIYFVKVWIDNFYIDTVKLAIVR